MPITIRPLEKRSSERFLFVATTAWMHTRRYLLCPLGVHTSRYRHDGALANFCATGCGHDYGVSPYKRYQVTFRSGERIYVFAVNTFHAKMQACIRSGDALIQQKDGSWYPAFGYVNHPDNVETISDAYD